MQYLRTLTNSLLGGGLVAAHLTLLLILLNPSLDLRSPSVVPLLATWWTFYAAHAAVAFYALIVIRQLLAVEVRPTGWISLRVLASLGTLSAMSAALVVWLNLRAFGSALEPETARHMTSGALLVSVCAVLGAVLAVVQLSLVRGRRLCAALFVGVTVVSLAGPLVIRGPGGGSSEVAPARPFSDITSGIAPPQTAHRVSMILLDGASLDFIAPIAADGRLPNFGRLLEEGAVVHLATMRPTQPAPVWTAVATGKLPYKNGVRSAARYSAPGSPQSVELLPDFCFAQGLVRLGLLQERTHSAVALTVPPLWQLLGSFGLTSGIVGWPLTYPVPGIRGYMISDEFLRSGEVSPLDAGPASLYPPEIVGIARAARRRAVPETAQLTAVTVRGAGAEPGDSRSLASQAAALDAAAEHLAEDLQHAQPARLTAVRYAGIDAVGHHYLRYATPGAFGDVSDEEREQFGRVLEQYYAFLDAILGRAMASLGPDDLLLVVSGFGMEPLSLGKRALERFVGNADLSGTHERAPDGFLLAYGRSAAAGTLPRASVVDVAPTVLYFLGLPIGRDMDGHARTDIFASEFTADRPITFVPYYW